MGFDASRLGRLLSGDARTSDEIRGDVDDEIAFHLEMRAEEAVNAGLQRAEAHRMAREQFGDVQQVRDACRKIQMGDRIVIQRIKNVLLIALSLAVVFLIFDAIRIREVSKARVQDLYSEMTSLLGQLQASENSSPPAEHAGLVGAQERIPGAGARPESMAEILTTPDTRPRDSATWLARFLEHPDQWRHGRKIAAELAALPDEDALRIMREIWSELPEVHRVQALRPFQEKPYVLEILHLGATDELTQVRGAAFEYLKKFAFQDFSVDMAAYGPWAARFQELPVGQVIAENAQEFVARLRDHTLLELESVLDELDIDMRTGQAFGVELAQVFKDAGALELMESWLSGSGEKSVLTALDWAGDLDPGDDWLQRNVLPLVTQQGPAPSAQAACRALGKLRVPWAKDPLLDLLDARAGVPGRSDLGLVFSASGALAEIGDATAIPRMIGQIVANPSYDTVYGVGYFGLSKLTGVDYDDSHDGAWWLEWWERNKEHLPAEVQALEIPR